MKDNQSSKSTPKMKEINICTINREELPEPEMLSSTDENWRALASAILTQAINDYRKIVKGAYIDGRPSREIVSKEATNLRHFLTVSGAKLSCT